MYFLSLDFLILYNSHINAIAKVHGQQPPLFYTHFYLYRLPTHNQNVHSLSCSLVEVMLGWLVGLWLTRALCVWMYVCVCVFVRTYVCICVHVLSAQQIHTFDTVWKATVILLYVYARDSVSSYTYTSRKAHMLHFFLSSFLSLVHVFLY